MGQGQEGGSVSPHSCSFITSFCNLYPEYRLLSRARLSANPSSRVAVNFHSPSRIFAFSRIPLRISAKSRIPMIPFSNLTAKSLNLTTALHFAVLSGNVEICELIIAHQEFLHFPESRSEFRPNPGSRWYPSRSWWAAGPEYSESSMKRRGR